MGSGLSQNDGTFLNPYGRCLRSVRGLEPACRLSPIKGGCGNGQALCVFFLDRDGGMVKKKKKKKLRAGTEGLAAHKAEEREALIQGTPNYCLESRFWSRSAIGHRLSFGKCELFYYLRLFSRTGERR